MKIRRKIKNNKGSATIEAIISFTGFLFVIFTILNVINFCRAQLLISNAVDTVTKELSQYSYFYQMSGLKQYNDAIEENAQVGAENINEVIGTVDTLYQSLNTAVDNSTENVTNVYNAVNEGNVDVSSIQNTLTNMQTDVNNVQTSMNSVASAFSNVGDNPMMYMKSIVAIAGSEALETFKSHAIAAPLAKGMITKHFGASRAEADKALEDLGVVDGLDGMNFNMSSIFTKDNPDGIHIVVFYKLKILQLFGWETLEVALCKESMARAWLGGDDVQVVVKPMATAPPREETEGSETQNSDSSEPESTESSDNEESGTGSTELWALSKSSEDRFNTPRSNAFVNYMGEEYGFEANCNHKYMCGQIGSVGYGCMNLTDSGGIVSGVDGQLSLIAENAYLDSVISLKQLEDNYNPDKPISNSNYKPGEIKQIEFVVYVPENISDEMLNDIKSKSELGAEGYKEEAKEVLGREVTVNISFVKAGGNYDYGSAE